MRSRLFIILIEFLIIPAVYSQTIQQIKSFSDEQFVNGDYELALKEYQRVLLFDTTHLYNDIYSKIASIYYDKKDYDKAIEYFNLSWRAEQNDSLKNEIALKKALCNFKTDNYYAALNELFDINPGNSFYFKNKINLYFGICYFGLNDYDDSETYFIKLVNSAGNLELQKLFKDLNKFNKKFSPERIELMSMLLPGLGQIYTGDIKSGLNSVLLLSLATTYGIITAVNYSLIDGLLVLTSWFYRYYMGGAMHANNLANVKILKRKAQYYSTILKIIDSHKMNLQ